MKKLSPKLPRINMSKDSRDVYYYQKLMIFKILAEADLSNESIRNSDELISSLKEAGLYTENLNAYWRRVNFVAQSAWGHVLELGSACGNITRYISRNPSVSKITAVDRVDFFIEMLKEMNLPKVEAFHADITEGIPFSSYDCVILSEILEHMSIEDELLMLNSLKKSLKIGSNIIVTTPIGFMDDPDHLRGFGRVDFVRHMHQYYGPILALENNGIQQFAIATYVGG